MDTYINTSQTSYIAIILATIWLIFRVVQVLSKSTEDIHEYFGTKKPSPPILSLAGLRSDGFVLQWRPGEGSSLIHSKFKLYLNGKYLAEVNPQHPSIVISGLQPDHGYIARIFAVSPRELMAKSDAVILQTLPSHSGKYYSYESLNDGAVVAPYKPVLENASTTSFSNTREHQQPNTAQKQNETRRRRAQANVQASEDTIPILSSRFEKLRREKLSLEEQIAAETQEFEAKQLALSETLEDLQQQINDKTTISKDFTRQVSARVVDENTIRKRIAAAESLLAKLQDEREKMRINIERWEAEAPELESQIADITKKQDGVIREATRRTDTIKVEISRETALKETGEERIRQVVSDIHQAQQQTKDLDAQTSQLSSEEAMNNEYQATRLSNQALEQQLAMQYTNLLGHNNDLEERYDFYATLTGSMQTQSHDQALTQAQSLAQISPISQSQSQISSQVQPISRPLGQAHTHAQIQSPSADQILLRQDALRKRAPSLGSSNSRATYRPLYSATESPTSLAFVGSSSLTLEERDRSMSGPVSSLSVADNLLPTGLLGDEMDKNLLRFNDSPPLPGLGFQENIDPGSPASIPSLSPSAFTSPRASTTNLGSTDPDPRLLRSIRGGSRSGSGSKFASLFTIRKPNRKTSDDGPVFSSSQALSSAQSFPRPENSQHSSQRRGSHSGTSCELDGFSLPGRSNTTDMSEATSSSSGWNLIGDPLLPTAFTESPSSSIWPNNAKQSSLPYNNRLSLDWMHVPHSYWTGAQSRATSSFGAGLDNSPKTDDFGGTRQQPIGTRPTSAHVSSSIAHNGSSAKLNPTAPSFKGFFTKSKLDKQTPNHLSHLLKNDFRERNDKASELGRIHYQYSPPSRNSSKETLETTDVTQQDRVWGMYHNENCSDSRSNSVDFGVRPTSSSATKDTAMPSEGQNQSQSPRESFIKRISRKSSVGFASLGRSHKRRESIRAQGSTDEVNGIGAENAVQDELMSTSVSSSTMVEGNGATANPSNRRFSFRKKKGKKKDMEQDIVSSISTLGEAE